MTLCRLQNIDFYTFEYMLFEILNNFKRSFVFANKYLLLKIIGMSKVHLGSN